MCRAGKALARLAHKGLAAHDSQQDFKAAVLTAERQLV